MADVIAMGAELGRKQMSTGVAVVCDTDNCFAVYLAVETVDFGFRQPVMTCPGCADGRGPVRERGDCRRCMGRVDSESRCVYCLRQVEPLQPEA
ncbi:hypothetical protein [Streptomyces cuspidosporus]|uniref:hypothetical protein n=1 Tax=Streptomyces cuspidosporus TaxID=66882 RepID=UPI0031FBE8F8